jgi:hypothetical protein
LQQLGDGAVGGREGRKGRQLVRWGTGRWWQVKKALHTAWLCMVLTLWMQEVPAPAQVGSCF